MSDTPFRILMVCMGNICRSPLAEGVARHQVAAAGLSERVLIDSAGTYDGHSGEAPDPRAQQIAREAGFDISMLRARPVVAEDFTRFDWILAMDARNLANLRRQCPEAEQHRVRLFLSFANPDAEQEVPDPYYGNLEGFRVVRSLCETGVAAMLRALPSHQGTL